MFVIGSPDAVWGFALAGVRGQAVRTPEELNRALDAVLADGKRDVVLVTEDVADMNRARVEMLIVRGTTPLVVEIPGPGGPNPNRPPLSEVIRRTIGVRI